ncbi:MAG: carboxypeptidase-like regulatory domain-containing protein [Saprospirales bacterium]|nr:carboxypeptidase-like regulatory domain-containing protein [Saprospirales bacterium]
MRAQLWLILPVLLFSFRQPTLFGQKTTSVKGRILDAATGEPLPYVSIQFDGTNIGTRSDIEGNYYMQSDAPGQGKVKIVCVGYETQVLPVNNGVANRLDVQMREATVGLKEITVRVEKYRNRGNPAVELIRKVIENKDKNRKEGLAYYRFQKYEKVGLP